MREIRFRAWNVETKEFELPTYRGVANLSINDILAGSTLLYQQFTGLKDKNGKEIYEGDIVQWVNAYIVPQKSFIKWDEEHGWWGVDALPNSAFGTSMKNSKSDYEVIGNIYENPDLLTT